MNFNKDHITELVLNEMAGTITDEDKVYLQRIIAENPEARRVWQDLHNEFSEPVVQQLLDELPNTLTITHIRKRLARRKTKQIVMRAAASAAVLVVAAIGVYFLLRPSHIDRAVIAETIEQKRVELKLADGQIIDLSAKHGQLQAGNIMLNNTNKTLSYRSGSVDVPQWATLTVPPGKDYTIVLDDNTEIQLNAGTSLKFPLNFAGHTREVTISGEAYLKVAKNTRKPFLVHLYSANEEDQRGSTTSEKATVRVLGTEFNVNTYDNGKLRVSLVEGSVKMKTISDSITLKPGNEATYNQKDVQVKTFDELEALGWRRGLYFFNDAPMEEVSRVLPRWFGVKVVIDKRISNRRFTGVIDRNQPISKSLDILKATNGMNYSIEGETIYIR